MYTIIIIPDDWALLEIPTVWPQASADVVGISRLCRFNDSTRFFEGAYTDLKYHSIEDGSLYCSLVVPLIPLTDLFEPLEVGNPLVPPLKAPQ